MRCTECGHEMSIETRNIPHTYRGENTVIENVTGRYCPSCGEFSLSLDEAARVSDAMLAFNKKVNASLVDPQFILYIRKKLQLTQAQANKIFGGGPNAFSRYETGKALPPPSLIQLLRLLDNHPSLLEEIRQPIPPSGACSGAAQSVEP